MAQRRGAVLEQIDEAARRAGRDSGGVSIVAVTKGHAVDMARAAVEAGLATLGENRVQEAATKIPAVAGASWHLVGPLQSNKARRAVELFDVIESVDSVDLARRLDRLAAELRPGQTLAVLLQVNVDADPAKAGFEPSDLEAALAEVLALSNLEVRGLMTVGRQVARPEDARPTFQALRGLGERLRSGHPALGAELSMGMSDDYPVAIEEGATIVRIGRALFGERRAVR
ncbi:MAG: YggS family pyridoxal phosphate-dependent enzyme [Chloroflexi bacterium]|nr:YggS family pyridoxal phosphate-dependent enzyme [Chloroflexota bacterium]